MDAVGVSLRRVGCTYDASTLCASLGSRQRCGRRPEPHQLAEDCTTGRFVPAERYFVSFGWLVCTCSKNTVRSWT